MVVLGLVCPRLQLNENRCKRREANLANKKMEPTRMRLGLLVRRSQTEKFGVLWRHYDLNNHMG
jgi:hypothetical protein